MFSLCVAMDWDNQGETLAFIQQGSATVTLWDKNTRKSNYLDTNFKEGFTFLLWAKASPQLAIGSAKGVILLYNKKTQKKVTINGKHSKKILAGAWNNKNYLAVGSEDKQV